MILLTSFGDWHVIMIALDTFNFFVVLLYLMALHYLSSTLLYIVSFVRHLIVALYELVTRSIVPLFVHMTLNGMYNQNVSTVLFLDHWVHLIGFISSIDRRGLGIYIGSCRDISWMDSFVIRCGCLLLLDSLIMRMVQVK